MIFLNYKTVSTRVPGKEGEQAKGIDFSIVTPNLKTYMNKFTVDSKRDWSPANTKKVNGVTDKFGVPVYVRIRPSDHFAIETVIEMNMIAPRR